MLASFRKKALEIFDVTEVRNETCPQDGIAFLRGRGHCWLLRREGNQKTKRGGRKCQLCSGSYLRRGLFGVTAAGAKPFGTESRSRIHHAISATPDKLRLCFDMF